MDEAGALWKEYADACTEHDPEHGRHVLALLRCDTPVDDGTLSCEPAGGRSLPSTLGQRGACT